MASVAHRAAPQLKIVEVALTRDPSDVFNIEVDGEHVYRILHTGVLVHNADYPGLNRLYDAFGSPIPFGFSSVEAFQTFVRKTYNMASGDADIVFQGSSVVGKSSKSGEIFDVGRVSDIDLGISSPKMFRDASASPASRVNTDLTGLVRYPHLISWQPTWAYVKCWRNLVVILVVL